MKRVALGLLVSLALVPGCGGDDDGGGDSPPDAAVVDTPALVISSSGEAIRVRQGEEITLTVEVERQGGLEGEVEVILDGLPSGMVADPKTVPSSATSTTLVIEALPSADHVGPVAVTITATSAEDSSVSDTLELPAYIAGAPGELDETFSADGAIQPGFLVGSAALDRSGRLVLAGATATEEIGDPFFGRIARHLPDGSVDTSFGDDGLLTDFGGDKSSAGGVVVAADDSLVALLFVVTGETRVALLRRYLSDGTADEGYGANGDAVVPAGELDPLRLFARGSGVVVNGSYAGIWGYDASGEDDGFDPTPPTQGGWSAGVADPSGRVLFAESKAEGPFRVLRLGATGTLDTSFGDTGYASFAVPELNDSPRSYDIALGPDGGGYAVGSTEFGEGAYDEAGVIVRFDADGVPDSTFGTAGLQSLAAHGKGLTVVVDDQGRALVGLYRYSDPEGYALIRLTADGTIDSSFGVDGDVAMTVHPYQLLYDRVAGRVYYVSQSSILRLWL